MVAGGDCSSCWKLCARLASGLVGAACAPGTLGALCCRAHDVYRSSLIAEDYLRHDSCSSDSFRNTQLHPKYSSNPPKLAAASKLCDF